MDVSQRYDAVSPTGCVELELPSSSCGQGENGALPMMAEPTIELDHSPSRVSHGTPRTRQAYEGGTGCGNGHPGSPRVPRDN